MPRILRYALPALVVVLLAGLVLPLVLSSRANADRVRCQSHLRDLGLMGVRHAAPPGQPMPSGPRDELPPGTFQTLSLPPAERASWFAYTLNVMGDGPGGPATASKPGRGGLAGLLGGFDPGGMWNGPGNVEIANYRLTTALCPAQVRDRVPGTPGLTNYIALGGLGLDTPALSLDAAGAKAGAYRYTGATPDRLILDGLRHTAHILETNRDVGPWFQGGPSTLRGLDVADVPYLGTGRPFGGCHPGGAYASLADGSVQFLKDTVDPAVVRSLFTLSGGPGEFDFDAP